MENKKIPFFGIATALITPFRDGSLDLARFRSQIERQIEGGIQALVVAGTTGEASTLTDCERSTLLSAALEEGGGKLPIIAGTGSNNTRRALELSREAEALGADALLIVTPYYNKGTESGVIKHYLTIAEACELPIILYNVPGRTGVDLTIPQLKILAEHPNIVAIKEAGHETARLSELLSEVEGLSVYTGQDHLNFTAASLGACGGISVLSNLVPFLTEEIFLLGALGETTAGAALERRLFPLIRLLFRETNPAPVKYAMAHLGLDSGELRLPLDRVSAALGHEIERALAFLG